MTGHASSTHGQRTARGTDAAWLRADWPAPPGVHALTTLRSGPGQSQAPFDRFNLGNARAADGDAPVTVQANRDVLVRTAQLPAAPRWLRQVHGTQVLRDPAAAATMADEPEADAAVTAVAGTALAILTADCLPVVLAAHDGSEVAAAHAGWRGLADGVLECTVAAMRTPANRVLAWLGPAAGPQAYEIGETVREAFLAHDVGADAVFVATRAGHWRIDLYALARQRLRQAGVLQVFGGGHCTITDAARFYSYRREGRTGRMATLVWRDGTDAAGGGAARAG